jgi:hypothetical protein
MLIRVLVIVISVVVERDTHTHSVGLCVKSDMDAD